MDVLKTLKSECEKAGGQRAWAKAHGVSVSYVSFVLHGKCPAGAKILSALGVEKVVNYIKLKD